MRSFQSISEGIVIVNDHQTIVASNKSANEMFCYEKGELKGKNLKVLIPKRCRSRHDDYASQYSGSGIPRQMGQGDDLHGRRKNGKPFPIEVGLNPFEVDNKSFVITLITDISIRKKKGF